MRRGSWYASLYLAVILVLSLLLSICLGGAPCLADNWMKTAQGGLEGHYSQIQDAASSMATYNGLLYMGTEDLNNGCHILAYNGSAWTEAAAVGFGNKFNKNAHSMCVYNGKLYVGTDKPGGGCEVWSFDGSTWSRTNTDGFGSSNNSIAESMAVYSGSLFVGTHNSASGAEVWRYGGGSWTRVSTAGFGDADNMAIGSLCVYGSSLYAGTYNIVAGCELWKYDGSSWTQSVGQDPPDTLGTGNGFGGGFENQGIEAMAVVNGKLYVGLAVTWDGSVWVGGLPIIPQPWAHKVWSFDGSTWTGVVTTGDNGGYGGPNFGNGDLLDSAMSMITDGSSLYVGTRNSAAGCQLWRFDGSYWHWMNTFGFGNVSNQTTSALAFLGSNLYAGTRNPDEGCDVWKYEGSTWGNVATNGFAVNNNYRASPMAILGSTLYCGTASKNGAELWKNTGAGWTAAGTLGFGDPKNAQVSSMATYNAKLYLGTMNAKTGGQVFSYDGSSFVQVNNGGFHPTAGQVYPVNKDVASMAAYGGYLFAGTENLQVWSNYFPGCEIYRYDGSTWTQERASGFGDNNNLVATSMCVYGDSLYVATRNTITGCEVWKRDPAGNWQKVNEDGFGSANNIAALSMVVFNGNLYAGTIGTVGRLWRYNGGTNWSQVHHDGFGESINMAVSTLAVFNGSLYAGTQAATGGTGQLWHSTDGTNWTKAAANGFGEATNGAVSSLAAFDSKIFAGTRNDTKGCEIWSSLGLPGAIQSATPSSGSRGQTLDVQITGSGTHFVGGTSAATFSGTGIKVNSTSVADATHAAANITIADDATATARDVNVITAQDIPASLSGGFTVLDPRITAVSPDSVFQGDTVELNITGADTHFAGGSSLATVSGLDVKVNSTSVVDSTHVKANITVGHDASPGARDVNVVTTGMTTRPLKNGLDVKSAPPRLNSVTLAYGMIGDTVTLKGDWFGSTRLSSQVTFNGKPAIAYSLWSETEIQCQVPAGATSGPVRVTTAAGSSAGKAFQVVNTVPGNNVSVDLGDGVIVVFDHVTTPGSTGASVIPSPSIADYVNVGGTSREITTTAGFNGNVTVTMSYAGASLLRYQEDGLALLHEESGQWVNVLTGHNSTAKTVTGRVTSLSRFAIAYPTDTKVPAAATWYLAEGSTDWGFDTRISIENPNNRVVTAQVTYMTNSGKVHRPNIKLPAMSQTTLNPAADLGSRDFSTKVVCLEGEIIAVDRTMIWTGGSGSQVGQEGHSSIGATQAARTWYLPEGSSKWGFETWVLVQNPNDKPVTCKLTYMIEGGKKVTVPKTVPANSRASFDMSKDIGQQDASIKVESTDSAVQVIAERAMYRNNRREGAASIGANTPDNDYYLAEGTTGWGFTTYVLVQNPNDQAADVALTFMTGSGQVQGPSVSMPANSRKTFKINDILPGQDFSTRVHGSLPIVAERAMYWDNGTGEASHASIGEAGAHRVFLLPDGETTIGTETWTLVQNPNPAPVKIEVSYLTASGQGDIVFTDTLAANSRRTYNMGTKIMNQRAAVMVKSKTPGKKIMVERSMYWNNRGAGTCTIGGYTD